VNLGRGLFRLWVILSGFWIAVCAAIVVLDGHLLEPKKTYDIEGPSKEKYEVLAPPNASEAEVVVFAQSNQRTDCSQGKTGPWCNYPVKLEMPRKPIDPVAIYLAIGVPAGALLIGRAFYWALSGFRRSG
jgi:hypothetical protein